MGSFIVRSMYRIVFLGGVLLLISFGSTRFLLRPLCFGVRLLGMMCCGMGVSRVCEGLDWCVLFV